MIILVSNLEILAILEIKQVTILTNLVIFSKIHVIIVEISNPTPHSFKSLPIIIESNSEKHWLIAVKKSAKK
jgi:hypothetical protein